jgi:dTDP-4-amino-4,6-dideoxygalactose transaminase
MEELPEFIRRKQANWELYRELFEGFCYGTLLPFREGTQSNHWFYSVCIDRDRIRASMREIITALEQKGIQTRAVWGLINEQKPYETEETYRIEKAAYYASRVLNIPSSTQITREEVGYVADEVKALLTRLAEQTA